MPAVIAHSPRWVATRIQKCGPTLETSRFDGIQDQRCMSNFDTLFWVAEELKRSYHGPETNII